MRASCSPGGQPWSAPGAWSGWLQQWMRRFADQTSPPSAPAGSGSTLYIKPQQVGPTRSSRQRLAATPELESWWIAPLIVPLAIGSEECGWARSSAMRRQARQRKKWADDERALPRLVPLRAGELPTYSSFPAWPQPGTFLHGMLELAGREGFANPAGSGALYRMAEPCAAIRRGLGEWTGKCLADWLNRLLQHPWPERHWAQAPHQPGAIEPGLVSAGNGVACSARRG